MTFSPSRGFTLIELSIVLVIIALVVGGVLVGKDLIRASEVQSQIAQINQIRTATNAFKGKYNCLPGDCKNAASYGFAARGQYAGQGDGDGVLEGVYQNAASSNFGSMIGAGELQLFFRDLSEAGLISEVFNQGSANSVLSTSLTNSDFARFFPRAKLGESSYVYVYSGLIYNGSVWRREGTNFFGLSSPSSATAADFWNINSDPKLKVIDAYNIDVKTDDGMPQSGKVLSLHLNAAIGNGGVAGVLVYWAGYPMTYALTMQPFTTATAATATSCFDNNNIAGEPQRYSTVSNAEAANCALSFKL